MALAHVHEAGLGPETPVLYTGSAVAAENVVRIRRKAHGARAPACRSTATGTCGGNGGRTCGTRGPLWSDRPRPRRVCPAP